MPIGLEITAWIDQDLPPRGQHAGRIGGTRPHPTEGLKQSTQGRQVTHGEIVCERIEGRVRAQDLPQRPQRAEEIWAEDAAVVIGDKERRRAGDVLETFAV